MHVEQARKLKELKRENALLKKPVADLSLDNSILKVAARGKSRASHGGRRQPCGYSTNSRCPRDGHARSLGRTIPYCTIALDFLRKKDDLLYALLNWRRRIPLRHCHL